MTDEYRRLLDELVAPFFVVQDDRFALASGGVRTQYGYEVNDLVEQHYLSIIAPEAREQAARIHLARMAGQEAPNQYETIALARNGARMPAESLAWATQYSGRPAVAGMLLNIAERKAREAEVLRAREQERMALARELHDDTIQVLLAVCQHLQNIGAGNYGNLPGPAHEDIGTVQGMVAYVIREVRHITENLRPAILECMGLVRALRWLTSRLMEEGEISVETRVSGEQRRLSPEAELALFRIAQVTLSNVRRYAAASSALVVLEFGDQKVRMQISDNGRGFEVPLTLDGFARQGKFGLAGISERVYLLGGSWRIESALGKGTAVTVEIPI